VTVTVTAASLSKTRTQSGSKSDASPAWWRGLRIQAALPRLGRRRPQSESKPGSAPGPAARRPPAARPPPPGVPAGPGAPTEPGETQARSGPAPQYFKLPVLRHCGRAVTVSHGHGHGHGHGDRESQLDPGPEPGPRKLIVPGRTSDRRPGPASITTVLPLNLRRLRLLLPVNPPGRSAAPGHRVAPTAAARARGPRSGPTRAPGRLSLSHCDSRPAACGHGVRARRRRPRPGPGPAAGREPGWNTVPRHSHGRTWRLPRLPVWQHRRAPGRPGSCR
jgi:hypothetical protein